MNRSILTAAILTTLLGAAASGYTQTPLRRTLLALSKTDHTLAIVDPATLQIIARIPVGEDPHEVIASADGKTAYVSIYGGGGLHELDVLDLVAQKPLPAVDTRPLFGPHGLVFEKGKAWFTAEGSKAIGRYDPATNRLDWSMGTGQDRTHMLYVTKDTKNIYTTNVSSGTVSILIDTLIQPGPPPGAQGPPAGTQGSPPGAQGPPAGGQQRPNPQGPPPGGGRVHDDWKQYLIPVDRGSEGFDVSPDGKELWTASAETGSIAIIDLQNRQLSEKVKAGVTGANRLAFTPDGTQVFISSLSTGVLTIYDARTRKKIKQLQVGHGAAGILMDPDAARAFVACSADNYIAIVDLKTLAITGHFDVGGVPDGMAWAIQQ